MLECMKNRRSIRKYTDKDIPESLLNELLECGYSCLEYRKYAIV